VSSLQHHRVTITNRANNRISAPVVLVEALGEGRATVHIETNYHIEAGFDHPATYATGSHEAKGTYRVSAKTFTPALTYIYRGLFTRVITSLP